MGKMTDSSDSTPKPKATSKAEWFKSNILWPGLFLVGFALVVTVLTLITAGPRADTKNRVESTYGVTVDRMPSSVLNDTIIVTSSDYSHIIRCSLPSARDMDESLPMKCKDSTGKFELPAL